MMLVGVVTPIIAIALILSEALFGAGTTKFVAVAQFLFVFGVLVPGAWIVGLKLHAGLNGIWISACLYAVLAASVMALKFRARRLEEDPPLAHSCTMLPEPVVSCATTFALPRPSSCRRRARRESSRRVSARAFSDQC